MSLFGNNCTSFCNKNPIQNGPTACQEFEISSWNVIKSCHGKPEYPIPVFLQHQRGWPFYKTFFDRRIAFFLFYMIGCFSSVGWTFHFPDRMSIERGQIEACVMSSTWLSTGRGHRCVRRGHAQVADSWAELKRSSGVTICEMRSSWKNYPPWN